MNKIYIGQVIFFVLAVSGVINREWVNLWSAILVAYILYASLEDASVFFIRSIPLFMAIPISSGFDNFNVWRILSAIIFIKWAYQSNLIREFLSLRMFKKLPNVLDFKKTDIAWLNWLLIFAILSLIPAPDKLVAVKKIIYFVNLSLIGVVAYNLILKNKELAARLVRNIVPPVIIVIVVGFVQLAFTYLADIYVFMGIWAQGIQCRQFGEEWCNIAYWLGNTWFAYYGEQLSLRMFSLFPDSHSFPIFLLLGLPSLFAVSILKLTLDPGKYNTLRKMVHTRVRMNIVWVALALLAAILSGTRGIWAGSLAVIILAIIIIVWTKRHQVSLYHRNLFKYVSLYLVAFYLLFAIAWPIFVSPQFLVSKGNWWLLGGRIFSIIDFGETSNSQRIEIWKKTLDSITEKPFIGVGIGNYPVVLSQDIELGRAGSSAHNLYLHIGAEMGILAMLISIWFLWLVFRRNYEIYIKTHDPLMSIYFGAMLLYLPWVLVYSLTDIAIFDERAFLLFVTAIALILANKKDAVAS